MKHSFLDIDGVVAALKRATSSWSGLDQTRLTQAIVWARTKHAGQSYAPAAEYAIHPIRAALTLAELRSVEPDVVLAAVLHDTLEDTPTTEDELREAFGDRVATIVKLVSYAFTPDMNVHEKLLIKNEALSEIRRGPIEVRYVKCADLLDQMTNWKRLPKESAVRSKLLRFLEEAQAYGLPLAEETDERLAQAMRRELQWHAIHAS